MFVLVMDIGFIDVVWYWLGYCYNVNDREFFMLSWFGNSN